MWFSIVTFLLLSVTAGLISVLACYPVLDPGNQLALIGNPCMCAINIMAVWVVAFSWSCVLDFFLALLPWYLLWHIDIKPREKRTICLSLSLGILSVTPMTFANNR